jgi:DNA-binding response OmpR family regulator
MNKKILLIDDDLFILKTIAPKFQKSGYGVATAKTAEEAKARIEADKPDIILLDMILPNVNGIEILKMIKNNDESKDIPVIIFSNLSSETEQRQAMDLGAIKYYVKADLTPDRLVEEVSKILSNQ